MATHRCGSERWHGEALTVLLLIKPEEAVHDKSIQLVRSGRDRFSAELSRPAVFVCVEDALDRRALHAAERGSRKRTVVGNQGDASVCPSPMFSYRMPLARQGAYL